jgi:hypothetical protein
MSLEFTFALGAIVLRLLQVLAGALFCWLGYRLFALVPTQESGAEITVADQLKANFSRVGPGVFFSIFGAAILIHGIGHPPTFSLKEGMSLAPSPGGIQGTAAPGERSVVIAGSGESVGDNLVRQTARNEVLQHIRFINRMDALVRTDLRPSDRSDLAVHEREIKLKLMRSVWEAAWGDPASFEGWARDNGSGPPNDQAKMFYASK